MKLIRKKKLLQTVAVFMAVNLIGQIVFPTVTYALTAGPGSPEFASFEPVATTDMVNVFSGDFTYNLPVVNVPGPGGGYAMSLSYHSGVSSEEESSWVGFGWTLNPGAINRAVRGVPDEYNGETIDYYQKARPNWTVTGRPFVSLEYFSKKGPDGLNKSVVPEFKLGGNSRPLGYGLEIGKSVRYNNYQGFGFGFGITAGFGGFGSLGMNRSSSGITFTAQPNPVAAFESIIKGSKLAKKIDNNRLNIRNLSLFSTQGVVSRAMNQLASMAINVPFAGIAYGILGSETVFPSAQLGKSNGFSFGFNIALGGALAPIPVGMEAGYEGSFNSRYMSPGPVSRKAFGYLHSTSDVHINDDKAAVSDYYVEKPSYYDKRDLYLGIPFSSPDYFNLSGEGLSGSFRLHNSKVGTFYPYQSKSRIGNFNYGVEAFLGSYLSIGVDIGAGWQKTSAIGKWGGKDVPSFNSEASSTKFMRFAGDPGGKVEFGGNDVNQILHARVKKGTVPGVSVGKIGFPDDGEEFELKDENGQGRSSYIAHDDDLKHFDIVNPDGIRYSYGYKNGNGATAMSANESNFSVDVDVDHIPYKDRHVIHQPIHLYKEAGRFKANHCAHEILNGQVKTLPYAQTHMLGEITSPDYIDILGDGPSDDDFGGWTKFNYFKKYGPNNDEGNSNSYRWRMPYTGLNYSQGSISQIKDDIGNVLTGEKDVHYLNAIETKTHVAFMVTNMSIPERFGVSDGTIGHSYLNGSQDIRLDGLGASALGGNKDVPEDASVHKFPSKQNAPKLEKLEKIVLFAKTKNGLSKKPLQTTYFSYSYELVGNLPNNINGNYPGNAQLENSGKLTLQKIWTEYEGTVSAKISPYEFKYQYKPKEDYASEVISQFPELPMQNFFNLNNKHEYPADQNPDYSPHLLGPWGYNRPKGEELYTKGVPWLYQGDLEESESYDPGAWQLKRIILPTGGEILVEYEAKDYNYVQNKTPMALVSLKGVDDGGDLPSDKDGYGPYPSYELNLNDIGISDNEMVELGPQCAQQISKYFQEEGNMIYFKFLYALTGYNAELDNCQSDYITGYAKIKEVRYESGKVIVELDGNGSGYDDNKTSYTMTPRQGCYDFYATQRHGTIEYGCESIMDRNYGPEMSEFADNYRKSDEDRCSNKSFGDGVGLIAKNMFNIIKAITDLADGNVLSKRSPSRSSKKREVCLTLNPTLSFLKIPLHKPKIGGGIRVKRLLTYDPGIESGDAALYGKVYHYVTKEGKSSGVATTEPASMREENALVDFMAKKHQSWLSRHIVGRDKEQTEGPFGESILPSPSVGHERIVEENIHSGKTGSGFVVKTFNTVREHYYNKSYIYGESDRIDFAKGENAGRSIESVEVSDLADDTKKDWMVLPTGVFNYSAKKRWAAQGYKFIKHDLHGKPESIKTYIGKLPVTVDGNLNSREYYLSQSQEFDYFNPGEEIRMLSVDDNGNRKFIWDTPGKEMDITMESSKIKDQNFGFALSVDIGVSFTITPPVPVPSITGAMASFNYTQKLLATHTTSKVLNYSTIMKSTTTYRDGIKTTQESLAFDQLTGQSILSATSDEYDGIKYSETKHHGKVYSLKVPAHWYFYNNVDGVGIGAKGKNDGFTNQLSASAGMITGYGVNGAFVFDDDNLTWDLPTDIVGASAQTFARVPDWFEGEVEEEYKLSPSIKTKLNNLYRPHESYAFKTNTVNSLADASNKKIFEEGIYNDYKPFNYPIESNQNPTQESEWIKLNTVTKYSPHGEPLEERDVLGNYSAAKFGYSKTLPVMVAQNARYNEIHFRDYEDFVFGPDNKGNEGHTGNQSLKLLDFRPFHQFTVFDSLKITQKLKEEGALLKFWMKGLESGPDVKLECGINSPSTNAMRVAKVGEWELISCNIPAHDFSSPVGTNFTIVISPVNTGLTTAFVDDLRFQPRQSQVACYVYDLETQRLIAQFDDQHFGLMYQYNGEGKLVRKLIETERGLKTIEETQYNVPVVDRRKNAFAQ